MDGRSLEGQGGGEGLEVEDLACSYDGRRTVVEGVSFKARPGGITLLLGPIASGKTTILRCIAGVLRPSRGRIRLGSMDLQRMRQRERARLIAYVPQQVSLADIYVIDAVLLGRLPHLGLTGPGDRDYEAAWRALRTLGIEELAYRRLPELSGGQLRLVAIARALAQDPLVLLLDEPTSNLDIATKVRLLRLIRRITVERGLITVASTHDVVVGLRYSDEVVLVKNGRPRAVGPPESIGVDRISDTYGIGVEMLWRDGKPLVIPVPEEDSRKPG